MQSDSARLLRISRALRAAAGGGAMRQVADAMREGARPLPGYIARAALSQLPHRGGLDRRVAAEPVSITSRSSAESAVVTLAMRRHDAATTDRGYVEHLTYGRPPLRTESIPRASGWWSDTLRDRSHELTPHILRAMQRVAEDIQR